MRLPWKYPRIDLGRPQVRIPTQTEPTDTTEEQWRKVPGWERFYRVSNLGRVWSLHQYGRLITGNHLPEGYQVIKLRENRRYAHKCVHQLVLMAFVGPPPSDKHEGCHNDGDPRNNRLDNLRWDTASGNQMDRRKHGRASRGRSNLTDEQIALIRTSPEIPDLEWAAKLGVNWRTIRSVRVGRTWRSHPVPPGHTVKKRRRYQSTSLSEPK